MSCMCIIMTMNNIHVQYIQYVQYILYYTVCSSTSCTELYIVYNTAANAELRLYYTVHVLQHAKNGCCACTRTTQLISVIIKSA